MSRPNIILIITDQQRYDTIGALGQPHMRTPTLDRLVAEGTAFTHAFVTAPSCAPSRASLFTGYYPHTTGVLKNEDEWRHSWVESLAATGYHCVNIGKMHTYPYETPLGFHERHVVENKDRYYPIVPFYWDTLDKALLARGLGRTGRRMYRSRPDYAQRLGAFEWEQPEDLHPDFYVGNLAIEWARRHPHTEPVFLQVGFPGPHPPYDPIARYTEHYLDQDLPILPVDDADLAAQPAPLAAMRRHNREVDHDAIVHDEGADLARRKRQRAYYLANITMIDEKIGELLRVLEEQGYLDDAVIAFTSDHGDALGDHGQSQKWTMYDCATRVPLILWSTGERSGRAVDRLVQMMDIGPTLLEFAGITPPETMQAQSLRPLMRGEAGGRDEVFAEHVRDGILQETEFMTMIRTRTHKLVHFVDCPQGQLFDLDADPDETVNRWDSAEHAEVKQQLLLRLLNWRVHGDVVTSRYSEPWR